MSEYHDQDWGIPVHNDQKLFEYLLLDAFQAGLSWRTILYKRKNFEKAFAGFDPTKIAKFSEKRLKIWGAVKNAKAFLLVQKEFGSFDAYIWQFVNHKPIVNHWENTQQLPANTTESDAMSKDLKKRGFTFVGSTICYAFMQATGMVNDHLTTCHQYKKNK
jgi:DNA-3-methyladenine glycosylase I